MPNRYQDIYPSDPLLNSTSLLGNSASELLTLEYFNAEPGSMPVQVFNQHHFLINLNDQSHRVENWRDGEHRDFTFHRNEVVVTPAGIESGWRWHAKSDVIVITLDPDKLEDFAQNELGILLTDSQLKSIPQFIDEDITQAGIMLRDALSSKLGSAVMFESLARVFLTKLIEKYGLLRDDELEFSAAFTSKHYRRVLDLISAQYGSPLTIEDLAEEAAISPFHFSRLFKRTIGTSPYQFLMAYRVEQARKKLAQPDVAMIDIAHSCGFSDQAHFSRVFKKFQGMTPSQFRASI